MRASPPGCTPLNALPVAAPAPAPFLETLPLGLEQCGYFVQPDGLPREVALALTAYAMKLGAAEFHAAQIGRGEDQQRNARAGDVRRH